MGFAAATFATGLLPTWQMVGVMAPILLIALRFMQGFFAGGEWGSGAVTMLSKGTELIPILLGINVIIGSIIILIGAKINPETRDVDLTQ